MYDVRKGTLETEIGYEHSTSTRGNGGECSCNISQQPKAEIHGDCNSKKKVSKVGTVVVEERLKLKRRLCGEITH